MEKHFMGLIWHAMHANLTAKEQQEKIEQILSEMKTFVQDSTKREFKNQVIKSIGNTLNEL